MSKDAFIIVLTALTPAVVAHFFLAWVSALGTYYAHRSRGGPRILILVLIYIFLAIFATVLLFPVLKGLDNAIFPLTDVYLSETGYHDQWKELGFGIATGVYFMIFMVIGTFLGILSVAYILRRWDLRSKVTRSTSGIEAMK